MRAASEEETELDVLSSSFVRRVIAELACQQGDEAKKSFQKDTPVLAVFEQIADTQC